MHEMSIAQSLIDIIQEEMIKHGASHLRSVRLRIGQLSAVVPQSISFCFEVMTSGTNLEAATLNMEIIPPEGVCRGCSHTFEIEDYAFECPHCHGVDIETISGQDLAIVDMEVD